MENYLKIIIAVSAALFLLIILLIIIYSKTRKEKIAPLNIEFLDKLYLALGKDNIASVDIENKRIRLMLNNVKAVDANALKALEIPAFLKGKELKLLIKEHTKEVYNFLTERGENNE